MAAELTQIIYDGNGKSAQERAAECYTFAILYNNENLTLFFEDEVIKDVVQASKADRISVCSWKLRQKMRLQVSKPRELTQEILESPYDVLSFTNNTKAHNFFAFGDAHHKGFLETFKKILAVAGITLPYKVKNPIYNNHFAARADIYKDYVQTYLIPCMEVIKNDPEVNQLAMVDSNYSQLAKTSAATSEYLKEKIGVGFYPLVPFLLERLFSVYCQNRNINVTYL